MKRISIFLISTICTLSSVFASQNKILVTYFSHAGENWEVGNVERGNTAIIGDYIQQLTGADVYEIEPLVPYPVDYYETIEVARKETSENARPQIKGELPDMSQYDTVIIGSPIWNGAPPMVMCTFYEALPELAVKTLVPFGTHGGSGVSSCTSLIKKYFPSAEVLTAFGMSGSAVRNEDSKDKVDKWLNDIGILPLLTKDDNEGSGAVNTLSNKHEEYSVEITGGLLRVDNLSECTPIEIYDTMGQTIYRGKEHQVIIEGSGVYFVRANNITKKVLAQ